nr:hexamerin-like [Leptinotarsa decemlineata]prf//2209395A diapause protein 1 [Leptinotarsa decemlineata]
MKISLVFLVGFCTAVLSNPVADTNYLKREQQILKLLYHVNQPSTYPEHVEIGKSCMFCEKGSLYDKYEKREVVDNWVQFWRFGLLPRGEVFSVFYEEHLRQAIALFKLFYYAKTYDEFHRVATWARQNVNEGMFVYAFSVAIIHRPDCRRLMLPPIYEIKPHYFFNKEVINKAYYYKQVHNSRDVHQNPGSFPGYTIQTNYTHDHMNLGHEQSLSYFLEDIDMNSLYYYYNLYYPFWMSSEEFGWKDSNRGYLYYFAHQQLLARYYLERMANGAGDIHTLDVDSPIQTPYNPSMVYPCGAEFPSRPKFAKLHEYFFNYGKKWSWSRFGTNSFDFMADYDRRMNDAIDQGFVFDTKGNKIELDTPEGFNVLGNLIQSNWDSPNRKFYGALWSYLRHFFGYSYAPVNNYREVPSALEHYETCMRDPMFFQIAKKMIMKFQRYLSDLPPYTEEELLFPGVSVEGLEFDPLITYNDWSYSDLTNGVFYNNQEDAKTFDIRVRQYRLNHKPFTYKIKVTSDKAQKAVVKVFMGPAYDKNGETMFLNENRLNFLILEHFVHDLKAGENVITRSSHEMRFYAPDKMSFRDMYKRVKAALEGDGEFKIDERQNYFHWPQRFMLPRGSSAGTPYRFFVIVYPYEPYHEGKYETDGIPAPGSGGVFIDNRTAGFPFDRVIRFEKMWYPLANGQFQEAKVYFKDIYDINAPHH